MAWPEMDFDSQEYYLTQPNYQTKTCYRNILDFFFENAGELNSLYYRDEK
jgi:hypothetical protein